MNAAQLRPFMVNDGNFSRRGPQTETNVRRGVKGLTTEFIPHSRPIEKKTRQVFNLPRLSVERATRIGLATEAWEAPILPLNYARV